MPKFDEPVTDIVIPRTANVSISTTGDALAIVRIYNELSDNGKQELLRTAIRLRREFRCPAS